MIKKSIPIIRYKKSKRKRMYSFWDTVWVYNAMQESMIIQANIEELMDITSLELEELPLVSIPGGTLYKIVTSNIEAFEKLLKESLIKTGNISKIQPTLH